MKGDLFFIGCLACAMSVGIAISIWNWQLGPEFWLFVPAFLAAGGMCVYASWGEE